MHVPHSNNEKDRVFMVQVTEKWENCFARPVVKGI